MFGQLRWQLSKFEHEIINFTLLIDGDISEQEEVQILPAVNKIDTSS